MFEDKKEFKKRTISKKWLKEFARYLKNIVDGNEYSYGHSLAYRHMLGKIIPEILNQKVSDDRCSLTDYQYNEIDKLFRSVTNRGHDKKDYEKADVVSGGFAHDLEEEWVPMDEKLVRTSLYDIEETLKQLEGDSVKRMKEDIDKKKEILIETLYDMMDWYDLYDMAEDIPGIENFTCMEDAFHNTSLEFLLDLAEELLEDHEKGSKYISDEEYKRLKSVYDSFWDKNLSTTN